MPTQTITFQIFRFHQGQEDAAKFQIFRLEVDEHMSVLDALEKIRLEQDASLMYRHSCHHSSCGSCACKINGREALTCVTKVLELGTDSVRLEPLEGFRKLGDLVVDMTGFYEHIDNEWDYLRESESIKFSALPEGLTSFRRLKTCIECGSCVSACPESHANSPFMGPAAMAALNNELHKSPEKRKALLRSARGPHGERWCERAIACSRVCPTKVAPAKHIAELRKLR